MMPRYKIQRGDFCLNLFFGLVYLFQKIIAWLRRKKMYTTATAISFQKESLAAIP